MVKLCQFVVVNSERVVHVNPDRVRYLWSNSAVDATHIVFDKGHTLIVGASLEEVVKAINNANRT